MDTPTGAPGSEKQAHTDMGKRILERAEDAFLKLVDLVKKGEAAKMMTVNESHHLQNDLMVLHFGTLSVHCRLTAIADRNGCDVQGGPSQGGGAQQRGGPGRLR